MPVSLQVADATSCACRKQTDAAAAAAAAVAVAVAGAVHIEVPLMVPSGLHTWQHLLLPSMKFLGPHCNLTGILQMMAFPGSTAT
jgi:hypothetical protein